MARDSILDEAEQNQANDQDAAEDDAGDGQEDDDGRVRLTQRTPQDLLDDVEAVQEQYHLPSRNAAINFMLKTASDDLLDE
ncbi:hypothetical protein [Halorubrum tropicale]|uniref:Uncharacterized protein n=1 Tax=Halorubrum tropicale TaxID=1765655 RepID=A0A0M9AIJ7_9EURY|nr:hypothetical protein [Halorubrum tropicale]KOX92722.1 hypothetical protein AMR74_16735 [Halorubrum tropicale]